MAVYTMANSQIYIGTTVAATDIATFAADVYVEIGEVESISDLMDTQNFAQFASLGDGRERDFKTTKKGERIDITCGFDPDDAGQDDLRDAAADITQSGYNFKIVYNDVGVTKPTTVYWKGKVGNLAFPGGDNQAIGKAKYSVTNDIGFVVDYRA